MSTLGLQSKATLAADRADWEQVRLNDGPPCFHIEDRDDKSYFCLRAERWHGKDTHPYVYLADLLINLMK